MVEAGAGHDGGAASTNARGGGRAEGAVLPGDGGGGAQSGRLPAGDGMDVPLWDRDGNEHTGARSRGGRVRGQDAGRSAAVLPDRQRSRPVQPSPARSEDVEREGV